MAAPQDPALRSEGERLVALYRAAAEKAATAQARAFFLTHAYVHALEAGLAEAGALHRALRDMGCED